MTTITTSKASLLVVKVPEGAIDVRVSNIYVPSLDKEEPNLGHGMPGKFYTDWTPLPEGTWELLCTTSTCTETDAQRVVEYLPEHQCWKNYDKKDLVFRKFPTALKSFQILLRSHGVGEGLHIILIKKD